MKRNCVYVECPSCGEKRRRYYDKRKTANCRTCTNIEERLKRVCPNLYKQMFNSK